MTADDPVPAVGENFAREPAPGLRRASAAVSRKNSTMSEHPAVTPITLFYQDRVERLGMRSLRATNRGAAVLVGLLSRRT
jgi:hypothetical protein